MRLSSRPLNFPVAPAFRIDGTDDGKNAIHFDLDLDATHPQFDHVGGNFPAHVCIHERCHDFAEHGLKMWIDREMFDAKTVKIT